jgi:hypothetical protein
MIVMDENNETISGAKIRIENTNIEFYTNVSGECLIPVEYINKNSVLIIESISYQTKKIDVNSNLLKINLLNR